MKYASMLELERNLGDKINEIGQQLSHLSEIVNIADLQIGDVVQQFYSTYTIPSLDALLGN